MSGERAGLAGEGAAVEGGIPARLRDLRARRGLSLRGAADEIGISFMTLTRIEHGKNYELRQLEPILRWLATDDGSCHVCGSGPTP